MYHEDQIEEFKRVWIFLTILQVFDTRTVSNTAHMKPASGAKHKCFRKFLDYVFRYCWSSRRFGPTQTTLLF